MDARGIANRDDIQSPRSERFIPGNGLSRQMNSGDDCRLQLMERRQMGSGASLGNILYFTKLSYRKWLPHILVTENESSAAVQFLNSIFECIPLVYVTVVTCIIVVHQYGPLTWNRPLSHCALHMTTLVHPFPQLPLPAQWKTSAKWNIARSSLASFCMILIKLPVTIIQQTGVNGSE